MITLKALSYFADGDLADLHTGAKAALSQAAADVRTIDMVPLASDWLT
jgi:hypothetical protein